MERILKTRTLIFLVVMNVVITVAYAMAQDYMFYNRHGNYAGQANRLSDMVMFYDERGHYVGQSVQTYQDTNTNNQPTTVEGGDE
jgi:hypothetical protein